MSRKQRRAQAFADRKQEQTQPQPVEESMPEVKPEISAAQLAANRANAQKSSGPTSAAGLKKVSQNALKTGLTGQQVLLPYEDAALYEAMVRDYQNQFQPVGPEETALLQSIVDCRWRLARVPGLESALLDLGRRHLVRTEPGMADNPAVVLEMQVRLYYQKDFRNLHLQENRLARRREREMKELMALQAARKAQKQQQPQKNTVAAPQPPATVEPEENGFEFSASQIAPFLSELSPETQQDFLAELAESKKAVA